MVCLLDKITNDPKSTKYSIKLLRGNTKVVFHMFLKSSNVPDISSIAIFSEDCISNPRRSNWKILQHHVSIVAIAFATLNQILA